jgi:hypothetical protein
MSSRHMLTLQQHRRRQMQQQRRSPSSLPLRCLSTCGAPCPRQSASTRCEQSRHCTILCLCASISSQLFTCIHTASKQAFSLYTCCCVPGCCQAPGVQF